MSKSILVIDMPNKCNECPCFYDYLHCQAKEGVNVLGDERPNICPLKPLPKRKSENAKTVAEETWNAGYNACIDEILGEE